MKIIHDQEEMFDTIRKCVDAIAIPVGSTLGPNGKVAIISRYLRGDGGNIVEPYPTKDGVTVAREIEPETPAQRAIFPIFQQVALRANSEAGDGTTTATVIARELVHLGLDAIQYKNEKPDPLIREIRQAIGRVKENLELLRRGELDDATMRAVATISMNGDARSANVVVDAFDAVGINGQIAPEHWHGDGLSLEVKRGYAVGYLGWRGSPSFQPASGNVSMLNNCDIMLIDSGGEVFRDTQLVKALCEKYGSKRGPLLIIFTSVGNEVLAMISSNKKTYNITALKMHGTSEYVSEVMRDIATVTAASIIGNGNTPFKTALANINSVLGKSESVFIQEQVTNFTGGAGTTEATVARAQVLSERAEKADDDQVKDDYKARASMLGRGAAVIKVGGKTPSETRELWDRVVDAISAVRSANEGGIVPGGGCALLRCSVMDIGDTPGAQIVKKAIMAPFVSMYRSAGLFHDGNETITISDNPVSGIDFRTGEHVPDMFAAGIVDPFHVVVTALDAAESIAAILLNTGSILCG